MNEVETQKHRSKRFEIFRVLFMFSCLAVLPSRPGIMCKGRRKNTTPITKGNLLINFILRLCEVFTHSRVDE